MTYLGKWCSELLGILGHGLISLHKAVWLFARGHHRLQKLSQAFWHLGVRCVPVVLLVGLFTGLVLGLQGAYTLERFGATSLLGPAVSLSLVRELAPVLTGLVVVGQAGSALSSELGIYRQQEHINALRMMRISPEGYLMGAPLLAALVSFPIMMSLFSLAGLWGGYLAGVKVRHLDGGVYWQGVFDALAWEDVRLGLIKAVVFGGVTVGISLYCGFFSHQLTTERGARAVSLLTTRAVIASTIAILVLDYLITACSLA